MVQTSCLYGNRGHTGRQTTQAWSSPAGEGSGGTSRQKGTGCSSSEAQECERVAKGKGNGKVSSRQEAPAPFLLELQCLPAYHNPMLPPERTPRQRIMELLIGARLTSHQLAQMLEIAERQVEEHLVHAVKSIARDKTRRFILEPSRCRDCDFVFRDRRRLTRPSRCPHCRSEGITAPRYGIESVGSRSGRVDSNASSW